MSGERRLLVRGFPHWLSSADKTSLLLHFGATEIVATPTRGKLRNCVFATFGSHEQARRALGKLHQLSVLQSRLVVEYVQDKHPQLPPPGNNHSEGDDGEREDDGRVPPPPDPPPSKLRPPSPPPRLCYSYPPPTPSTLTNITHALVSVPKFYKQVLHLMNLMNLPPPFGPVISTPPPLEMTAGGLATGRREERESEVESEVGSDREDTRPERRVREVKRRAAHLSHRRGLVPPVKRRPSSSSSSQPQFDSPLLPVVSAPKISLNVPSKIEPRPPDPSNVVSIATISDAPPPVQLTSPREREERGGGAEEEDERDEELTFISSEELARNRLSQREMREVSVFRGYSAGEPSLRLYIKNLSRQTTEQDLKYVYGRYVDWSSEREKAAFDVRLMQTGRMKGQAFVGLPSEEAAARALRDTNGYQLAGRPIVVHFARTAKAKPSQET